MLLGEPEAIKQKVTKLRKKGEKKGKKKEKLKPINMPNGISRCQWHVNWHFLPACNQEEIKVCCCWQRYRCCMESTSSTSDRPHEPRLVSLLAFPSTRQEDPKNRKKDQNSIDRKHTCTSLVKDTYQVMTIHSHLTLQHQMPTLPIFQHAQGLQSGDNIVGIDRCVRC